MNVEITKEAFNVLIGDDRRAQKTEALGLATRYHFERHGVVLIEVSNFITPITQYFIQDINV